ncbi:putative mannan endo-1,4-beta-mannosidase 9 [Iris pallida]|uniref:mannan endo-1,4-beta-mannosidase n=1 Tax=Iris pallida TaxID=29817 RepID=A0AAX6H983_IRIPA|nr:putative mannan endo-1,4-beta-mannosidase 9 [Iris pallida]
MHMVLIITILIIPNDYDVFVHLFMNHANLTRKNSITGVTYKDDPNIFEWELINEPRCQSDLSGTTDQWYVTTLKFISPPFICTLRNGMLQVLMQ